MLYAVSERSYFLYHPGLLKSSRTLSMRNEKIDAIILFFIMFFCRGHVLLYWDLELRCGDIICIIKSAEWEIVVCISEYAVRDRICR